VQSLQDPIMQGEVNEPTSTETDFFTPEQIKDGWRLACLTLPKAI
jgi:ferredoxin